MRKPKVGGSGSVLPDSTSLYPTSKKMLPNFTIEFSSHERALEPAGVHRTDDPVEAVEYLMQLLLAQSRILSIKHDGVDLPQGQSDQMLKVAGERLLSQMLARALDLDTAEVRHRFAFAA